MAAARSADVSKPFGGVPYGVKELEQVEGWPNTEASLLFKDRVSEETSCVIDRAINRGGAVPVGLTTSSEFGGLNVSITKLNGVAHNPWQYGKTVGGSSGGSAAAVSGGLVSLASGGDGGGSIRIPAGYTGLLGFKGTYGRIPRVPDAWFRPGTVVVGNLSRSVRDAARYYDVCAGQHPRDPASLPSKGTWEADLGSHDLAGKTVAVIPSIGGVKLEPGVAEQTEEKAEELIAATGMRRVEASLELPSLAAQWAMGNLSTLITELEEMWPARQDELTSEIAFGLRLAETFYNLRVAGEAETRRLEAYNALAELFDKADFVICATNPGPAFPAESTTSNPNVSFLDQLADSKAARRVSRALMSVVRVAGAAAPSLPNKVLDFVVERIPDVVTMGGLTIPANLYGNPSVSIPAGTIGGLPVGMQVMAQHHQDALLFDVALAAERAMPWPMVAPGIESTVPA
jgi:aspartyl-tRNA(Asn)/glutamyl-tRNA(Gln) amidotransferase subunit A